MLFFVLFFIEFILCCALKNELNLNIKSSRKCLDTKNYDKENCIFQKWSPNNNKLIDFKNQTLKKPIYFQFITSKLNKRQTKKKIKNSNREYLQRIMLFNNSTKCNDGTNSGYYLRRNKKSKKWIIFLEGGWFCYSMYSCHQRWIQMRNFMTSAHWPEKRLVNGILSSKKNENQFFYKYNHVYVPYCSSDGWAGNNPAKSNKDLHFSGSKIIKNIVLDLINKGLQESDLVYLSGSSAGATGVLINLDELSNLIKENALKAKVYGLIDSGWFLDNEPYQPNNLNSLLMKKIKNLCTEGHLCSPLESIKKGFEFWNGQIPESCKKIYSSEPWKCFFGHRIYQTLKTPIFVIQFIFDEAQMTANNIAIPTSRSHWDYIYKMGIQLRNSLENVTGLFAPSCISHTFLTKKNWNQIKINGLSLSEAIHSWEIKQIKNNENSNFILKNNFLLNSFNEYSQKYNPKLHSNELELISPSLHTENFYSNFFNFKQKNSFIKNFINKKPKRKTLNLQSKKELNYKKSGTRLIDNCNFPQCNSFCPKLRHFITGEEITFFDLLKEFGFKIKNLP